MDGRLMDKKRGVRDNFSDKAAFFTLLFHLINFFLLGFSVCKDDQGTANKEEMEKPNTSTADIVDKVNKPSTNIDRANIEKADKLGKGIGRVDGEEVDKPCIGKSRANTKKVDQPGIGKGRADIEKADK